MIKLRDSDFALRSRTVRIAFAATAIVLAALLSAQTIVRNQDWSNVDLSLFRAAVTRNPHDADLQGGFLDSLTGRAVNQIRRDRGMENRPEG